MQRHLALTVFALLCLSCAAIGAETPLAPSIAHSCVEWGPNFYGTRALAFPLFGNEQQLLQEPEWLLYLSSVYGGPHLLGFPIDTRNFTFFYHRHLPLRLKQDIRTVYARYLHDRMRRAEVRFGDVYLESFRSLKPEDHGYTIHAFGDMERGKQHKSGPFLRRFPQGIPSGSWVEVTHRCCEYLPEGFWMFFNVGTGIFYNLGKTIVFQFKNNSTHVEACNHFGGGWRCVTNESSTVPAERHQIHVVNPFVRVKAREAGYDSVQVSILRFSFAPAAAPLNFLVVTFLQYLSHVFVEYNETTTFEILDLRDNVQARLPIGVRDTEHLLSLTHQQLMQLPLAMSGGRDTCHGDLSLFRTGWQASLAPCLCDSSEEFLHCRGSGFVALLRHPPLHPQGRGKEANSTALWSLFDPDGMHSTRMQLALAKVEGKVMDFVEHLSAEAGPSCHVVVAQGDNKDANDDVVGRFSKLADEAIERLKASNIATCSSPASGNIARSAHAGSLQTSAVAIKCELGSISFEASPAPTSSPIALLPPQTNEPPDESHFLSLAVHNPRTVIVVPDSNLILSPSSSSSTSLPIITLSSPLPSFVGSADLLIAFNSDVHGHVSLAPLLAAHLDLLTMHRQLSTSASSVLLLSAGDSFVGSEFFAAHGPLGMAHLMRILGYKAMALGNHDMEFLSDIPAFVQSAGFPVLSVNVKANGVKPSVIVNIDDEASHAKKIGVMGYTDAESAMLTGVSERNHILELVREEAKELRRKGCDAVILLGHGGVELDSFLAARTKGLINVILGGHAHALHVEEGEGEGRSGSVLVIHAGHSMQYLGLVGLVWKEEIDGVETLPSKSKRNALRAMKENVVIMDVEVAKEEEKLRLHHTATKQSVHEWLQPRLNALQLGPLLAIIQNRHESIVSAENNDADDKMVQRRNKQKEKKKRRNKLQDREQEVGRTLLSDSRTSCRVGPCVMGKFIADAMRRYALCEVSSSSLLQETELVIALRESGSIRSQLWSGPLHDRHVREMLPWNNQLVMLKATGGELRQMVERSLRVMNGLEGDAASYGGAVLQTAGLRFGISDNNSTPKVTWLRAAVLKQCNEEDEALRHYYSQKEDDEEGEVWKEVNDEDGIWIVVTEWLAEGGDGYARFLPAQTGGPLWKSTVGEVDILRRVLLKKIVSSSLPSYASPHRHDRREDENEAGNKEEEEGKEPSVFVKALGGALGAMVCQAVAYSLLLKHVQQAAGIIVQQTNNSGQQTPHEHSSSSSSSSSSVPGRMLSILTAGLSSFIFWLVFHAMSSYSSSVSFSSSAISSSSDEDGENWTITTSWIPAFMGGVANVLVSTPLWVIITRLQVASPSSENCVGFSDEVLRLWKEEGFVGFWRGLFPNLVMILFPVVQSNVYVMLEGFAMEFFAVDSNGVPFLQSTQLHMSFPLLSLSLGALSSMIATTLTYPIQVLRVRHQAGLLLCPTSDFREIRNLKDKGDEEEDEEGKQLPRYRHQMRCGMVISIFGEVLPMYHRGLKMKLLHSMITSAVMFFIKEHTVSMFYLFNKSEVFKL
ncbi:Metallophos domain-containing protein [Balamuthia mandrillaris]